MDKLILAFLAIILVSSGCNKESAPPLTKKQIQHIADSLAQERIKYYDEQAKIMMEHRMKIELKIKVDSAVQAINLQKSAAAAQSGKDTVKTK
jgi:hypothetical protein